MKWTRQRCQVALRIFGDRGLQPLVGVGDDELHAAQAAAGELAQELDPERLGLRRADVHAEHLAPAVGVDADRDDHRHRDDPPVLAHLQVGRVDPEVGPVALQRPLEEGRHPLVDLGAEPAHLALRHPAHAERLHEVVDRARRDAVDVGLLDDGRQRLLGHPPRLEEAGEVRARAAASGCAAPPFRPASPSPGRGSRCAGPADPGSSRPRPRRSGRPPPAPSAARRRSRSSRAADRRRGSSRPGRAGSSSRRSSWISGSGWLSQPDPTEEPAMTTAPPPARQRLNPRGRAAALPSSYTTTRDTTSLRREDPGGSAADKAADCREAKSPGFGFGRIPVAVPGRCRGNADWRLVGGVVGGGTGTAVEHSLRRKPLILQKSAMSDDRPMSL